VTAALRLNNNRLSNLRLLYTADTLTNTQYYTAAVLSNLKLLYTADTLRNTQYYTAAVLSNLKLLYTADTLRNTQYYTAAVFARIWYLPKLVQVTLNFTSWKEFKTKHRLRFDDKISFRTSQKIQRFAMIENSHFRVFTEIIAVQYNSHMELYMCALCGKYADILNIGSSW
jgi:hypothetical protein